MVTDVDNDNVGIGDFLSEYTALLVQSHGKVDEQDDGIDTNDIEDCGDQSGDPMDTEDNHEVDSPEKIPLHFEILIKVFWLHYNTFD